MADEKIVAQLIFEAMMDAASKRVISDLEEGFQEIDDSSSAAATGGMTDFKSAVDLTKDVAEEFLNIAKKAFEFAEMGANADRAATAFTNLAGGEQMATEKLEAMLAATNDTIPKVQAMEAASKLMAMGLANTTDELAEVTEMAVVLGRAFGRDATEAIDEFSLLLANESKQRLDTFGISSANVRQRMEEMGESFKEATFAEAAIAMERLGDAGLDSAGKIEQMKAAIKDAEVSLVEDFVPAVANAASSVTTWLDFHDVQNQFDDLIATIRKYDHETAVQSQRRVSAIQNEHGSWVNLTEQQDEIKAMAAEIELLTGQIQEQAKQSEAARVAGWQLAAAMEAETEVAEELEFSMNNMEIQAARFRREQNRLTAETEAAEQAIKDQTEADKLAAAATAELAAEARKAADAERDLAEAAQAADTAQGDLAETIAESESGIADLNQVFFDAADAVGLSGQQFIEYKQKLEGLSDPEAATLARQTRLAEVTAAMGVAFQAGRVTIEEYLTGIADLKEELEGMTDVEEIFATDIPDATEEAKRTTEEYLKGAESSAKRTTGEAKRLRDELAKVPQDIANIPEQLLFDTAKAQQNIRNLSRMLREFKNEASQPITLTGGGRLPDIFP